MHKQLSGGLTSFCALLLLSLFKYTSMYVLSCHFLLLIFPFSFSFVIFRFFIFVVFDFFCLWFLLSLPQLSCIALDFSSPTTTTTKTTVAVSKGAAEWIKYATTVSAISNQRQRRRWVTGSDCLLPSSELRASSRQVCLTCAATGISAVTTQRALFFIHQLHTHTHTHTEI